MATEQYPTVDLPHAGARRWAAPGLDRPMAQSKFLGHERRMRVGNHDRPATGDVLVDVARRHAAVDPLLAQPLYRLRCPERPVGLRATSLSQAAREPHDSPEPRRRNTSTAIGACSLGTSLPRELC